MSKLIAIDGPVSSGKSTIGWLLAQKLNYQFIDTGIFYRLVALKLLRKKISLDNQSAINKICENLDVEFISRDDKQQILSEGQDITDSLHTPEVTKFTPLVAANSDVRRITKKFQQTLGGSQNTVMTGRDIGSEIFPETPFKFYITASAEVRAKRRFNQLKKTRPDATFEKILEEIADRDLKDTTRAVSPLRIPEDAIIIDTSELNIEETVTTLLKACSAVV